MASSSHVSPLYWAIRAFAGTFSARNLSVRFGGVLAVNNVSFDVREGEVFTLIGPNGAGKTTVFNLISRIYTPTTGEIEYQGQKLTDQPPHAIAALGIARTFQNIELFEHATVLHNLLIGRHTHRQTGFLRDMFFTAAAREAELQARLKAEEVIDLLHLQHYRDRSEERRVGKECRSRWSPYP